MNSLYVFFVNGQKPLHGQQGIYGLNTAGCLCNNFGQTARRYYGGFCVRFFAHALYEPVHHIGIAVRESGLDIRECIAPDNLFGNGDVDLGEFGAMFEERLGGELDARNDDAALVFRVCRYKIEGRCRTRAFSKCINPTCFA